MSPFTPPPAQAGQQWRVAAGASSRSEGIQALGFYPADIWINAGDSVTWSFRAGEQHTVTFGTLPQRTPPGAPGPDFLYAPTTPNNSMYHGTEYVNSGNFARGGGSYTVNFATPAGTFPYLCLIHPNMKGNVYVAAGGAYPHDQQYYDRSSQPETNKQLASGRQFQAEGLRLAQAGGGHDKVTAGNGDGFVAVDVFMPRTIRIRPGQTITWTNPDPVTPHTVSFGPEPLTPLCPGCPAETGLLRPVGLDSAAGAPLHATISANPVTTSVHSAIIGGAPGPRGPSPTQFSVTFTAPGTYQYICALHDDFGMTGTVIVETGN